MKVMLVDDERIAIEHLRNLIPWEQHGFEITATASNGRSALRLCEEHCPQVMIVDIRMPVMDGIELIRAASEKRLYITFIVMSAYEDFEYARQALSSGNVSSYLIKHEVNRDKLLRELTKARTVWESGEQQRQLQLNGHLKDVATGAARPDTSFTANLKMPVAMLLVHPDTPFAPMPADPGRFGPSSSVKWASKVASWLSEPHDWTWVGDFPADGQDRVVLFSHKNKQAGNARESLLSFVSSLKSLMTSNDDRTFSVFYTVHASDFNGLPSAYRQLCTAAGHAVFYGREALACADELPLPGKSASLPPRRHRFRPLNEALERKSLPDTESAIRTLFESVTLPFWDLQGLHEIVAGMKNLLGRFPELAGMPEIDPFDSHVHTPVYDIDGIANRFVQLFSDCSKAADEIGKFSGKLTNALDYIHSHYDQDMSIDDVSHATGFSASYLHLLFKKELDRTFLDYLTAYRIEQAKRILRREDAKMTEVASRVGYRSHQHFSQVFKKWTGTLPHLYRDGGSRS